MTAKHLLHELETLPHAARIRRMVELGRAAAHDSDITSTLTTLEQGNFYERFLALHSCFGSYDGAHVLRALTDPSRIMRGTAISLTVLACDEEQLRQALRLVPRDGRLPLLWKLYHHGYHALIDEFLEHLAVTNDPHLRKLLPCGSPALVRRFIGYFQYRMGLADWRRLARRHPAIAVELLHEKAASTAQLDVQLVAFANSVLPILAKKQPNGALRLVEALARTAPLHRLDLDALCLKHPAEVVDLVLREGDPGDLPFHHIAHRLDQQRLLALIKKYFATLEYHSHWLPTFKPETRLALYTSFSALWRDHRGCLSADLVALLPRTQREQEGRRHLALSALATHPEKRLPYAAFLPWDEAYHLLEPFLHDPSQNTRVLVLQTLTQAVQYERHRLPDLLTLVCTHLNEPDPVRGQIVNTLAELPQSIWRLEHLEELESITRCIIDAFDTSSFTVGALLFLLLRVLACAPEWSAAHMALVTQKYGLVLYADRRKYLTEQVVRQIGPALRPVLISWAEQGDEQKLQPLIALFGKRVSVFEVLLDALEVALKHHPSAHFGNTILATFRKHSPERMAHVIPQLLQKGEDKILYPEILTYMFRYRQDLLTPLFAGQLQTARIPSPNGKSQARQKGRRKSTYSNK